MFYRQVAKLTRDHMQAHLRALLDYAEKNQDEPIKLPNPKRFDVASYVGGVVGLTITKRDDFPALAIDATTRGLSTTTENLYLYRYDGQVTGMISADNPDVAERIAKGYLTAFDSFCANHAYQPVATPFNFSAYQFSMVEFAAVRSEHFGAARVEAEDKGRTREVWVDGFRVELAWIISESGSGQHNA